MRGLQASIQKALKKYWDGQSKLVVAVSTGVDSMLLLHELEQLHYPIVVAHVNHHLRTQSDQEAQFIAQYCREHHIAIQIADWHVADHPDKGVEEAARQFRYRFFSQVMDEEQSRILLTAHHQNDLAETVLMKLVRGGWLKTIVGLQTARTFNNGWLLRPWLQISKEELLRQAQVIGLTWYEDQSNQSMAVQRNRFRHQILPALIKEDPKALAHLGEFHDQLTKLLTFAEAELSKYDVVLLDGQRLKVIEFNSLPAATQDLYLKHYFNQAHLQRLTKDQLNQGLHLLTNQNKPQGQLDLSADWRLVKTYQYAWLQKIKSAETLNSPADVAMIELEKHYFTDDGQPFWFSKHKSTDHLIASFNLTMEQLPLRIRKWQPGDRLRLKNGGHQKIHRILIDQKVPQSKRTHQQVVVDQFDQVLWLVGRKTAWETSRETTQEIYLYYQGDNHDDGK
ncbi:tRNA lysidine(34) synthetase TilS [Limosilactobacillus gastricus]|uniref:tRNA(Ile)-lysidine synthase n=1 Tax=Limosilactobacillus gastricus DSM 16045 TaxID=1423749 RepID=A0A0R1V548_9LACO|nr:tRNA lysidine(34) synthetase TilS [Limosilactobacillus gastricus]KRM00714.1 tRNA(Ile)-lysidine synthetase [Limosilactobacillus gastricus DSM 16045]QGF40961.1 tRNA lysidine(34) synthetase TilS [Limosilactobacillus gastricus]